MKKATGNVLRTDRQRPARLTFLLRSKRPTPNSVAIWPSAVAALALALVAACGGGTEQTPLPGAVESCEEPMLSGLGELIDCDEVKGVALVYNEYLPEGEKVDHYWLIPLRVSSVDDFRAKRDWAWKHWDVWERESIDICEVRLAPEPNDPLIFELSNDDFEPAQCH